MGRKDDDYRVDQMVIAEVLRRKRLRAHHRHTNERNNRQLRFPIYARCNFNDIVETLDHSIFPSFLRQEINTS